MNSEYNQYTLKSRQALPLEDKVRLTLNRIKQWYEFNDGDVYISFSGGKDSTVLAFLVWSLYPNVPAVFSNTGLEYPEIIEFINYLIKQGYPIKIIKPKITFNKVIEKYGYPIISKEQSQYLHDLSLSGLDYDTIIYILNNYKYESDEQLQEIAEKYNCKKTHIMRIIGNKYNRGRVSKKFLHLVNSEFKISDKCCYHLKKSPFKNFEKQTGLLPFLGEMAEESDFRMQNYVRFGCNAFKAKRPVSRPLIFWKDSDIWEYILQNNIPYAKIYDMGYKRTGCVYCMYGCHLDKENNKFQLMKQTHPKLYNYCINKLNCGKLLDLVGVKYD